MVFPTFRSRYGFKFRYRRFGLGRFFIRWWTGWKLLRKIHFADVVYRRGKRTRAKDSRRVIDYNSPSYVWCKGRVHIRDVYNWDIKVIRSHRAIGVRKAQRTYREIRFDEILSYANIRRWRLHANVNTRKSSEKDCKAWPDYRRYLCSWYDLQMVYLKWRVYRRNWVYTFGRAKKLTISTRISFE